MRPRVKICCISSVYEAKMAIDYGADALGLVSHMPSGPGVIDDNLISEIVKTIPPPIASFLLTCQTDPRRIIEQYQVVNTSTIQMVDRLENRAYDVLRDRLPHVKLVQVIHVIDQSSIQEAIDIAQSVDAILLDSGNPNLPIKELGGTGRTHNWALSRTIVDAVYIPVFLAGGLNDKNVREAISTVRPYGIDLCSGVRTKGKLDPHKLKAFFEAVNF